LFGDFLPTPAKPAFLCFWRILYGFGQIFIGLNGKNAPNEALENGKDMTKTFY
jgi:hypothetical protein